MCELTIQGLSREISRNPLIIHINPIGLLRLGSNNKDRVSRFDFILNEIQNSGGNIAVPVYSYSYTKNEIYNLLNTTSDLGDVTECLRISNREKRTIDANFSYLLFGNGFSDRHFEFSDYASFGEGSLIEEIFKADGYLGAIGGALEYLTEIHFLEHMLNITYRFDKDFCGTSIDKNGIKIDNNITYFCRDLSSNYSVSFVRLKKDIRSEGLVKVWNLKEFKLKIEVVKIRELYRFIEGKLKVNENYLWQV